MNKDELTPDQSDVVDQIVGIMKSDMRIFVVTGAGMSAESGLPTYRGVGGLYNSGNTEQGMSIEQLLSGSTFRQQPELTWKYLGEIGKAASDATFNQGHRILAEMEPHFEGFCVLTQNIDGFHSHAGSKNVIEIHGNLHHLRCDSCQYRKSVEAFTELEIPPFCDKCQEMMRPDVVLFDEMLLPDACEHLTQQWQNGFDLVMSIGTTSVFPYIAEPVLHCSDLDKPAIEINPSETQVSGCCRYRLPVSASLALGEIWKRYRHRM